MCWNVLSQWHDVYFDMTESMILACTAQRFTRLHIACWKMPSQWREIFLSTPRSIVPAQGERNWEVLPQWHGIFLDTPDSMTPAPDAPRYASPNSGFSMARYQLRCARGRMIPAYGARRYSLCVSIFSLAWHSFPSANVDGTSMKRSFPEVAFSLA